MNMNNNGYFTLCSSKIVLLKKKSLRMHDWASYFKNVSINIWKATIILLSEVPNSVSKIQKALESTI